VSQSVRSRGGSGGGGGPDGPSSKLTLAVILGNPGLLKLELMTHGLRLSEELSRGGLAHVGPSAFATAYELDVLLPSGTAVTAPVHPVLTADSPYVLHEDDNGHRIVTNEGELEVVVSPPPRFYKLKTRAGVPFGRFATMHGSYLAVSPINECKFLTPSDRCRFCSVQGTTPGQGSRIPVDDVVEAVRAAQLERPIRTIYLSVGFIDGPDSGVSALEPYVQALKKSFNVLVAVDALPPAEDEWIDRTYAMGVDSVAYNMEIFGEEFFQKICPGPARQLGRQRFLDALSYATTVFNDGAVISHLIVGMEPIENTIAGVDDLVRRRVVPVLPVYRPFKGIDLRQTAEHDEPELTTEELSGVYAHLYTRLREKNIPMGWVRDISVVTTPMEGRFFVGANAGLVGFFNRLFNDPHRKPSPRLVDIRRALRVRLTTEE
jgi:sodium-dependent dicarboxylate transporter 2/3/5